MYHFDQVNVCYGTAKETEGLHFTQKIFFTHIYWKIHFKNGRQTPVDSSFYNEMVILHKYVYLCNLFTLLKNEMGEKNSVAAHTIINKLIIMVKE